MDKVAINNVQEARRPIVSLISKSEKALLKLAPGTWQHAMLRDNLKALRTALGLMDHEASDDDCTRDGLQAALDSLASMKRKTAKAHAKFPPGTSQHALLRNRFKALRASEALVKSKLDALPPPGSALI